MINMLLWRVELCQHAAAVWDFTQKTMAMGFSSHIIDNLKYSWLMLHQLQRLEKQIAPFSSSANGWGVLHHSQWVPAFAEQHKSKDESEIIRA